MSIYTTNFQALAHGVKGSLMEKIDAIRGEIFNFNYDIPNNVDSTIWRDYFERMFILHYFHDDFAFSTPELFQAKLMARMWAIMPVYAKRLEVFYSVDKNAFYNITKSKQISNTNTNNTTINEAGERVTINEQGERVTHQTGETVSSDLPINIISTSDIDNVSYATNGGKTKNDSTNEESVDTTTQQAVEDVSTSNGTANSVIDNEITSGNVFQYLQRYNADLGEIILDLLNEFSPLFMWVW